MSTESTERDARRCTCLQEKGDDLYCPRHGIHSGPGTVVSHLDASTERRIEGWTWSFVTPDSSEVPFYRQDVKMFGSDIPGKTQRITIIFHAEPREETPR